MNKQMFELMMQRLGTPMLPPPSTYNPVAQPLMGSKPAEADPNAQAPTSILGKIGAAIAPNAQAAFAGKGGAS